MRVCLNQYALLSIYMKSWVIEGSVDGQSWTEIDQQSDNQDLKQSWRTVSFAISSRLDFRFIRLTQTEARHDGRECLSLRAVEFFGTVSE
jgi:hypothetical protein